MKSFFLALFLSFTVTSYGKPEQNDCFAGHIREAIQSNKESKRFYSHLTAGASDRIYTKLIRSEYFTLPLATFYDFKVRRYETVGVPVFCDVFLSMKNGSGEVSVPEESFQPFDWKPYSVSLKLAIKAQDLSKVKELSLRAVTDLREMPRYHCMLRHMFESIYRFAHFIPLHEELARKKSLKSPREISFAVLSLQVKTFKFSSDLDQLSGPIQEAGIPVLCAELPPLLEDLVGKI